MCIPRDDVLALQQSPEYNEFFHAFERLGHAHRRTIIENRTLNDDGETRPRDFSFLQHSAVDDVVLRVFEFLECAALTRTSITCHRFRELAKRSAEQRTHGFVDTRVLGNSMKMMRAKEQIEGVVPNKGPFVRVPILGLSRRVLVTEAGDDEYNGIYFCTEMNGNGFIFTKPRQVRSGSAEHNSNGMRNGLVSAERAGGGGGGGASSPGRVLRCVIAKRFSDQTILWYMSKEVRISDTSVDRGPPQTEQPEEFAYWATLMVIGEATLDVCRYPSQTSILSRNGEPAWQALSRMRSSNPPVVELLE